MVLPEVSTNHLVCVSGIELFYLYFCLKLNAAKNSTKCMAGMDLQ